MLSVDCCLLLLTYVISFTAESARGDTIRAAGAENVENRDTDTGQKLHHGAHKCYLRDQRRRQAVLVSITVDSTRAREKIVGEGL